MKGKHIYFTAQEISALLLTLGEWEASMMPEHESIYAHRLQYGLGTAWGKLCLAAKPANAHENGNHAR